MKATVFIIVFLCAWLSAAIQYEILPYNPIADPKAVITYGHARFTVLTPNLIRMEYDNSGKFEDRATVAVVNRLLPVPEYTQANMGGVLVITTSALILKYSIGEPFTKTTLNITARDTTSPFTTWSYGDPNPSNLLGTIKSLDELNVISLNCNENNNVKVHDEILHCEWGLISRAGWVVVNDTSNWGLDSKFWWDSPNRDDSDLYFFGHMYNYKQALLDYVKIGGRIAMVPRQASGIWWSRWYNVNNIDVTSIVKDYKTRDLPLDVYILDMDWHAKYSWGGYTVDSNLFPYPSDTFNTLASEGLIVGANLHDADGIHPYEKMYKPMCEAMGINPNSGVVIPFSAVNATYMFALDDIVLGDIENQGMNFWWIDWQQGGTQGGCQGDKQNPTYILNHVRGTDSLRRGGNIRGLVLARWGGLGTHRYQVGFSGDVSSLTWSNLAFQPYFSLTASNVAYGFWSHDLVGPAVDHELHTRWLQWGAYSAIFRTHDRGMSAGGCNDNPDGCPRIEVWNVPDEFFKVNREAMLEREALIPYIYNAVRQAYDTGISILRPMYYEYPLINAAYGADANGNFGQYFFGDDMFVAPITKPGLPNTTMAVTTIWIPPGTWIEKETGVVHMGDTMLTKSWDISEIPVFIRAGAIIPRIPVMIGDTIGIAQRQYNSLVLTIYPESTSGTTVLYEDDGKTTNYISGKSTLTTISYTRTQTDLKLSIQPSSGSFPEFPKTRTYTIELVNSLPVISATVNGIKVLYSKYGGLNTWRYDGPRVTTIIETASLSTGSLATVMVTTGAVTDKLLSGFRGAFQKSILAKRNLDLTWSTPGSGKVEASNLADAASTPVSLSYLAGTDLNIFYNTINGFRQLFAKAIAEVQSLQPKPPPPPFSLAQLWNEDREDNCLCATQDCLESNSDYEQLRIEGFQPKPGSPDTVPLNDFWNDAISDNYATTQTITPQGYSPAVFGDGIVYRTQQPNTVPLQLYWSEKRKDMLTVASTEGIQYANLYGYKLMNASLGYVLTKSPEEQDLKAYGLTLSRWAYSMELLYNALN